MPFAIDIPQAQHALLDPETWDKDWDDILKTNAITPHLCLSHAINTGGHLGLDQLYAQYSELLIYTCKLQFRLSLRATACMEELELERKWTAAAREERRRHVLVGISTACSKAQNLNAARGACGDIIRLDALSAKPETFLDLLRSLIHEDLTRAPTTPRFVPNITLDAYARNIDARGTDVHKIHMLTLLVLRTELIYMVIEFSFHSFLGVTLPHVPVGKDRIRPTESETMDARKLRETRKRISELTLGKEKAKAAIKDHKVAQKARASKQVVACARCNKVQPPEETFKQCTRCKQSMRRDVPYCSKACQKEDWKIHKPTCGKPFDLATAIAASVATVEADNAAKAAASLRAVPNVGPPVDGFVRSAALAEHVQHLNANPDVDLCLHTRPAAIAPPPTNRTNVDFGFPPVKHAVRALRDAAMCQGEGAAGAYASVCHFVVWFFVANGMDSEGGYDIDCVTENLAEEFGIPFDALKAEVLDLHEMALADPFGRPAAMSGVRPEVWDEYVQMNPGIDLTRRIVFKSG